MKGSLVCRAHGGAAPAVKAKAAERVAEDKARAALAQLDPNATVDDPVGELSRIAAEVVAFKNQLRAEVDRLERLTGTDYRGAEQVRAILAAYERALDRCERTLATIVKLDLEDRLVRLREHQVTVIVTAVRGALDVGQLEPEQRRVIEGRLASNLRAVSQDGA